MWPVKICKIYYMILILKNLETPDLEHSVIVWDVVASALTEKVFSENRQFQNSGTIQIKMVEVYGYECQPFVSQIMPFLKG